MVARMVARKIVYATTAESQYVWEKIAEGPAAVQQKLPVVEKPAARARPHTMGVNRGRLRI